MPSSRKMIALRPDAALMERVKAMAVAQRRSVASMAEVLLRTGIDVYARAHVAGRS